MLKNVNNLPNLIKPCEYEQYANEKLIKFKIEIKDGQIHILGDSPYPDDLTKMMQALGKHDIEYVLCG